MFETGKILTFGSHSYITCVETESYKFYTVSLKIGPDHTPITRKIWILDGPERPTITGQFLPV